MTKFFGLALAVLAVAVGWPVLAVAQTLDLSDAAMGSIPAGFAAMQTGPGDPGRWEVIPDVEAAGGRAVVQSSVDPTDGRFPLLIRMATAPADVSARTRFKAISGKVDQAAGLAVRLLDPNNYYLVRANALEGNVRLYKVIAGRREQIAGADMPVTAEVWHELGLSVRGDRLIATFDGRELFSVNDGAITTPGKVAFWTKADSVTRFDCLDVRSLE